MNRRGFLLSALAAPFVIRTAGVLMPVKAIAPLTLPPVNFAYSNGMWRPVTPFARVMMARIVDPHPVEWRSFAGA
jgi:hypothetical protein